MSALIAFPFSLLFVQQVTNVFLQRLHPNQRSVATLLLLEDVGVLEVVLELGSALDPGIADLAHFHRVEFVPPPLMEILIKLSDELCVDKVDEGIADIAVVLYKLEGTL